MGYPIRRRYGLIFMAALCVHARVATGQPAESPIALSWNAPTGLDCPSVDVVYAEVERLLGGKPQAGAGKRLDAQAHVVRKEDGAWTLTMHTALAGEEANGERTLHGASCAELGNAAALIIALGFDPAAVAAQVERTNQRPADVGNPSEDVPRKTEDATPEPPAIPPPIVPVARAAMPETAPPPAQTKRRSPVRFGVELGVGGDLGSFLEPAYSVLVASHLRYGRLEVVAKGMYFPAHRTASLSRPTAGGTFTLITGGLSACGAFLSLPRFELGGCGGIDVGRMFAEGYGVVEPGAGSTLWLAPHVDFTSFVSLAARLGLRFEIGIAAPLIRNRFVLENVGVVYEPAAGVGRVAVGVEFHF